MVPVQLRIAFVFSLLATACSSDTVNSSAQSAGTDRCPKTIALKGARASTAEAWSAFQEIARAPRRLFLFDHDGTLADHPNGHVTPNHQPEHRADLLESLRRLASNVPTQDDAGLSEHSQVHIVTGKALAQTQLVYALDDNGTPESIAVHPEFGTQSRWSGRLDWEDHLSLDSTWKTSFLSLAQGVCMRLDAYLQSRLEALQSELDALKVTVSLKPCYVSDESKVGVYIIYRELRKSFFGPLREANFSTLDKEEAALDDLVGDELENLRLWVPADVKIDHESVKGAIDVVHYRAQKKYITGHIIATKSQPDGERESLSLTEMQVDGDRLSWLSEDSMWVVAMGDSHADWQMWETARRFAETYNLPLRVLGVLVVHPHQDGTPAWLEQDETSADVQVLGVEAAHSLLRIWNKTDDISRYRPQAFD